MKPGWALTSVGGVRYDGTHYSIESSGTEDDQTIIVISRGPGVYQNVPYPFPKSEYIRAPNRVDKSVPPRSWSFQLSDYSNSLGLVRWVNFRSNYQFIQLPRSVIIILPISPDGNSDAIELPVNPQQHYPADICRFVDSEDFESSVSLCKRFSWAEWMKREEEFKLWGKHL